jgi:hypothetical protein
VGRFQDVQPFAHKNRLSELAGNTVFDFPQISTDQKNLHPLTHSTIVGKQETAFVGISKSLTWIWQKSTCEKHLHPPNVSTIVSKKAPALDGILRFHSPKTVFHVSRSAEVFY